MPTQPAINLPTLALDQAKSPVVRELFTLLQQRAHAFAALQDQFSAALIHDRELREGKPFRLSEHALRSIERWNRESEQAEAELKSIIAQMNDASLVFLAWATAEQALNNDLEMWSDLQGEPRRVAQSLLQYQRETIELIDNYIPKTDDSEFIPEQIRLLKSVQRR